MFEIVFDSVEAEKNSINPTINVWVKLKYTDGITHGFVVSGKLSTRSGKLLSINCAGFFNSGSNEEKLEFLLPDEVNQRYGKPDYTNSKVYKFSIELSQAAVAFIEKERHIEDEKTVHLQFVVETIIYKPRLIPLRQVQPNTINGKPQISVETKSSHLSFSILHSEWVNRFCPHLGIGRFLLLELNQPAVRTVSANWDTVYEIIRDRLILMEENIRKGEWRAVMIDARQVVEDIKVFSGRPADRPFYDEFVTAFKAANHSEDGIRSLEKGIKAMFDFCSKYIHTKDMQGNTQPSPTATKEEAEFAYAMLLSFVNLLGSKLRLLQ